MKAHSITASVASALLAISLMTSPAIPGTTGTLAGRVVDAKSQAPIAGAVVTAASPEQGATATTDAGGGFVFVSLAPDTYTVSVKRSTYEPQVETGVVVAADQGHTLVFELTPALRTIATVSSDASALVRPGTTSDVYSLNASTMRAVGTLTGSGSLNQAYGAMSSVPGVVVPQGQQGWYQFAYIRGGAEDQVGWELDGIPVNRAYDNAPQTMLSTVGLQELQVYTGGTPATSDASGISGYVNQVIKQGSYPGYATISLGAGAPTFYHQAGIEISGATPDRDFSYYFATLGADQAYRYINQSNGAGSPGFFYPLSIPSNNGYVFDGSGTALFSPGNAYGIANTQDRETVANVHLRLPHRHNAGSDDVQFLFDTGLIGLGFYSSVAELGGLSNVDTAAGLPSGVPLPYANGVVYTGTLFAPVDPAKYATYYFPSSPGNVSPDSTIPLSERDTNENGFSLVKLQYQHSISNNAFARIFGYTLYSSWFEHGPLSADLPWGDAVADYENIAHTGGLNGILTDQIARDHLLTLTGNWSSGTMMRYETTGGFPSASSSQDVTNFVGANGLCYNWSTGAQIGCYDSCSVSGEDQIGGSCSAAGDVALRATPQIPGGPPMFRPAAAYSCGGASPPPACKQNPQWLATASGYSANLDAVAPISTALAFNDYWSPNDRLSANLGLRIENYSYDLANTAGGYPARAFWFKSYDAEYCYGSALAVPVPRLPNAQGALLGACPSGTTPVDLIDASGGTMSATEWQPRLGAAYTSGRDDVLRASWGVYAQPARAAWAQFNTSQQDLASYLGKEFLGYGFNTPVHQEYPARSYNSDFSWEHRLHGTQISFKLTPFYRSTADQMQSFDINSLTGLHSGLNVGNQISSGVEFEAHVGDANRNGLSTLFSYTYTRSAIRFSDFSNGRNVIDNLNNYIQQFNSYTKACATPNPSQCGTYTGNAQPTFTEGGVVIANPYYEDAAQPLLDRNATYPPYDVIPSPFAGANGHDTPDVASLAVTYKHNRLSVTPTLAFSSGAEYGSPLVWPGYVPQYCTAVYPGTKLAQGSSCANSPSGALPYIFIPDPYTGQFDNLGAFKEPDRISLNVQASYKATPRVTMRVALLDLVDKCFLRGYAWENQGICDYAELPSSALAPVGNFVPLDQAPPQLRYPYAMWLNNNEVGTLGTSVPFQATFTLDISL